jgi:T-complex protein 1 subunit gamma
MCRLALEAIRTVSADDAGVRTVDIKRYARVDREQPRLVWRHA